MRDLLEKQVVQDAKNGDTTVLEEVLTRVPDRYIFGALDDAYQMVLIMRLLKGFGEEEVSNVDNYYHIMFNNYGCYISKDAAGMDGGEQVVYDHIMKYYRRTT